MHVNFQTLKHVRGKNIFNCRNCALILKMFPNMQQNTLAFSPLFSTHQILSRFSAVLPSVQTHVNSLLFCFCPSCWL